MDAKSMNSEDAKVTVEEAASHSQLPAPPDIPAHAKNEDNYTYTPTQIPNEKTPLLLQAPPTNCTSDSDGEASPVSRPPSYATLVDEHDRRLSTTSIPIESSDEDEFLRKRKAKWRSRLWRALPTKDSLAVLLALFIAEASRGLVLPTMYTYVTLTGGTLSTLGTLISLFSVGRLICAVPFGTWADRRRSSREVLIFASLLAAISNFIYAIAYKLPNPLIVLYISRLACGFATGTVAVCRAYLASSVQISERTKAIAWSGMAQYAGFSLTPGLATVIMWMGGSYTRDTNFNDDNETKTAHPTLFSCVLPTFFLILLNILLIPILLLCMPKKDPIAHVPSPSPSLPHPATSPPGPSKHILRYAFVLFFTLNLVLRGVIGVTETIAPEMYQHHRINDDSVLEHSGRFFFLLGLGGLVVFFLVDPLQRLLGSGPSLLLMGISMVVAGTVMNIDPTPARTETNWRLFIGGMVLIWSLGSPIVQTLTVSQFSKMLGSRPQGSLIGWITTAGSIGRIVFPALIGVVGAKAVNWMDVGGCVGCAIGVGVFERYMKGIRRREREEVREEEERLLGEEVEDLEGDTDREE